MLTRISLTVILVLLLSSATQTQNRLTSSYDWRDHNILSPVKHQKDCGSCGEFAAAALFEALIKKQTGADVDLSEQQIVSCVAQCGCNSGCSSLRALQFIRDSGIVLETDFPYLNKDTGCIPGLDGKYFISNVITTEINRMSLDERIRTIKQSVIEFGPVATNMALYDDLGKYRGGVYNYNKKAVALGGHWVLIVGWKDDPSAKAGGYWICRNSWGEKWGQKGYFNSAYGDATGIDDFYIVFGLYNPPEDSSE
jgi:C1A family cysteine protease